MNTFAKTTPMVSVVVLTYRNFNGLIKTLDTISQQSYKNIELIISDDGSNRFPQRAVSEWVEHCPIKNVIVRLNKKNLGTVRHANLAAAECSGEYIKFLSPDDGFCDEYALERMVNTAVEKQAQILTSPALVYVNDFKNVKYAYPAPRRVHILQKSNPKKLFSVLSSNNIVSAAGTIFHRAFFEERGFDESYRLLEDWPTWLSFARNGGHLHVLKTPTVYYAMNGISNSLGNAFEAVPLKSDLIRCYEKEILPHQKMLSRVAKWRVNYRYGKLTGADGMRFWLCCFPIALYEKLKQAAKQIIVK